MRPNRNIAQFCGRPVIPDRSVGQQSKPVGIRSVILVINAISIQPQCTTTIHVIDGDEFPGEIMGRCVSGRKFTKFGDVIFSEYWSREG